MKGLETRLAGFEPTNVRVRTVCVTNFATAVWVYLFSSHRLINSGSQIRTGVLGL